jgi:TetR/AcrR family tetracycline transcriptional repressor
MRVLDDAADSHQVLKTADPQADADAQPAGRAPLSCERIIAAAVQYIDANCLDDLSMRRLGAELGVEAMSLYRYFPSKAALLDAVVSRLLGDVSLPPAGGGDWEPQARAYARSFRAIAREHPQLIPLMATMGPSNPALATIHERMCALWRSAGLGEESAPRAQCTLHGYLTGSSLWDANRHEAGKASDPASGSAAALMEDEAFEFGLDVMMCGLRDQVAARQA